MLILCHEAILIYSWPDDYPNTILLREGPFYMSENEMQAIFLTGVGCGNRGYNNVPLQ